MSMRCQRHRSFTPGEHLCLANQIMLRPFPCTASAQPPKKSEKVCAPASCGAAATSGPSRTQRPAAASHKAVRAPFTPQPGGLRSAVRGALVLPPAPVPHRTRPAGWRRGRARRTHALCGGKERGGSLPSPAISRRCHGRGERGVPVRLGHACAATGAGAATSRCRQGRLITTSIRAHLTGARVRGKWKGHADNHAPPHKHRLPCRPEGAQGTATRTRRGKPMRRE